MTKGDSERKKEYANSNYYWSTKTYGSKSGKKEVPYKVTSERKKKYTTISEEVEKRMKKETPKTYKFQLGLSPVTHLRKYLHKKQIKKELASRPEHLSPAKVRGN